ncbi:MAG TPA: hypothetical protein VMJ64_03890 [Anaerolineales bacterium]|nr:hypothetical protein [Anaerolineales bacterium]
MTRPRWPVLLVLVVGSLLLAYLLRDLIFQLIVVPLAYLLWLLQIYYSLIPQWLLWTFLVVGLLLVVLWNLLPEITPSRPRDTKRPQPKGEVEALAAWISNSRRGNYFKWQLANRFGRIARGLDAASGPVGRQLSSEEAVEKYLDAGMNYSFVDFLVPGSRFMRPPRTALDTDIRRVADYLESQMENSSDRRR